MRGETVLERCSSVGFQQYYVPPGAIFSANSREPVMNPPRSAPRREARLQPHRTFHCDASASTRWETGRVWEEAGIIPPLRHRVVAELLHRLAMGEESSVVLLAQSLARAPFEDARCRVIHPARLRLAAQDFGLCTAGRTDEAIACDVASAVIDEYAPE